MCVRNPTFLPPLFPPLFPQFLFASMCMNGFITCLVHVFFKGLNFRVHAARAAGALLLLRTGCKPNERIARGK